MLIGHLNIDFYSRVILGIGNIPFLQSCIARLVNEL